MAYLAVALGGAIGAVTRYGVSGWLHALTGAAFPVGTLAVNVAGSFVIGLVFQLATDRHIVSPEVRLLLITGFCGALTTFSTFSFETLALIEQNRWAAAAGNTLLNLAFCFAATLLGFAAGRAV